MESSKTEKKEEIEEEEEEDPNPDIHALFCHYNSLYFSDALGACLLSWSSKRMTLCAGVCRYEIGGGCEIRLSEPLLKYRSSADVKNTLLHEMIHAYLWITNKNKDHSDHGPSFQKLMNEINSSTVIDHQRPAGGYNITIYHTFHDEVNNYRVHHWVCQSCGDLIKRAMNREPSPSDCIVKAKDVEYCGDASCHWHVHKVTCGGDYVKISEPPGFNNNRKGSQSKLNSDLKKSEASERTRKGSQKGLKGVSIKSESEICKSNTLENFYPIMSKANVELNSSSQSSDDLENDLRDFDDPNFSSHTDRKDDQKACDDGMEASSSSCDTKDTFDLNKRYAGKKRNHMVPVREIGLQGHNYLLRKKRKRSQVGDNEARELNKYTVIIQWNNWYANEEEEDVEMEPLRNKRTERRKKQKLFKNVEDVTPEDEQMEDVSHGGTISNRSLTYVSERNRAREDRDGPSTDDSKDEDNGETGAAFDLNAVTRHQKDLQVSETVYDPATSQSLVGICRSVGIVGGEIEVVDLSDG